MLQDAEQRAAYDRQLALQAAAENVHINETVPLEDMDAEEVDGQACLAWPCRCGGSYLVLAEEAEAAAAGADGQAAELIVPCTTCSLNIRALAPPRPAQ